MKLLIKVSFVEKIRVQAEYILNSAAVCFEIYRSTWLRSRDSLSSFCFQIVEEYFVFFSCRATFQRFHFHPDPVLSLLCFCLSKDSASHAFLSRTLCFISAFQPLNHISVTSYCAHTHAHTYFLLWRPCQKLSPHTISFLLFSPFWPHFQSSQHFLFLFFYVILISRRSSACTKTFRTEIE